MVLSPAHHRHLNALGCFSVVTFSNLQFDSDEAGTEHVCGKLIAPLMASAIHARLYPSATFHKGSIKKAPIFIPRRGYLEFNLAEECVKGFEDFWGAGAKDGEYRRGTIVVVQPRTVPLATLLSSGMEVGVMSSRYQILKGSSAAAVKYAEQHARKAERLFVFSASNGARHVEIYPPKNQVAAEFLLALASGARPFT